MTKRERPHGLVEDLPEDPVARALRDAPFDDEPVTPGDLAALEVAEEDSREGRWVSHAEARRQLLRDAY